MTRRLVTGTIFRTTDVPWQNVPVYFRRKKSSYTPGTQYPKGTVTAMTDNFGRLTYKDGILTLPGVPLWCNEEGVVPTEYECVLPDEEVFSFSLSPGNEPVDLSDLRVYGVAIAPNRIKNFFSYGDASPRIIVSSFAGTIVSASVVINTPFNGTASLKLGDSTNPEKFISAIQINPRMSAEYKLFPGQTYTNTNILLTISIDPSVTQGNGIVILEI